MLATKENTELSLPVLEKVMMNLPQVECSVVHRFGPGIYIREVTLPAGTMAIGHHQKYEHTNIMLTGKVAMIRDDGSVGVLEAPMFFVGQPGRKIGYVIETCVWQNIYATDERDIATLESMFIEQSDTWQATTAEKFTAETIQRAADRDDYAEVLAERGLTEEQARAITENTEDQIHFPDGQGANMSIRDSTIQGSGMFLSYSVSKGEFIAYGRIAGKRTPAGRYINHSKNPNCEFVRGASGDIMLFALRNIAGCLGGGFGEELTVDYRQANNASNY